MYGPSQRRSSGVRGVQS